MHARCSSGGRAGYHEGKRKKGSKVHAAVDTRGNLLPLTVTAGNEQERSQVADLAQKVTGGIAEVAFVDQGYTGKTASQQARDSKIELEVVKHHEAKHGFVCCPEGEWWNASSVGSDDSDDSHVIMSDLRRH
ncbi:MAG: transposase [Planctomycetota bacterium]